MSPKSGSNVYRSTKKCVCFVGILGTSKLPILNLSCGFGSAPQQEVGMLTLDTLGAGGW